MTFRAGEADDLQPAFARSCREFHPQDGTYERGRIDRTNVWLPGINSPDGDQELVN